MPPSSTLVAPQPAHSLPVNERWTWGSFRLRQALPPAESSESYELHLAAVEYALASSIAIRGPEDIRSKVHWEGRFDPFAHQVRNLLTFCRRAPVALIADDVGLGKTVSAGLILSELMARQKVERVLVVAPCVLHPQWKEEMESKFGLEADHGTGKKLGRLVKKGTPVVITTYHTLRNHYDDIEKGAFDMIVLDEAHKLRNLFGTSSPPGMAQVLRKGLSKRDFKFVLMLTATPIQNRLWDLYSLVDCLAAARGNANPFGKPSVFAEEYLADSKTNARQLLPESADEFRRILATYMIRHRRTDCGLQFPERSVQTRGDHPSPQDHQMLDHLKPVLRDINPLARISVAQAFMSSPEALKSQLSNMAERGSVTKKRAEELMHLAGSIENTGKMRRLLELADTLKAERPRDWRMVVFTTRKATQEAIGKAFRTRDVPVAYIRGGAAEENREAVQDFWAEEPGANVLISTDAGAEGLNLQVANVLVNYDLPWNPMLVEQRIGRIQRLSSRHANVLIFNLVTRGTVEERIVGRLMEKLQAVSSSLGDVEGILESFSAKDELGLEKEIRELVLESMQGIDVEARVRKLQESIDEAKALYEQEQAEVERHLGTMLEMEQEGPLPPELSETTPRKGVQGFATGALIADGGALTPDGTGGWTLEREDEPVQRVRFKAGSAIGDERGVQAERGTLVFREGRPDFERLVDEWCARDAHRVHDLRSVKAPIKNIVSEWVAEQAPGAELLHVERLEESSAFQGSLAVRAGAEVAHDRYEKLMEVVVRPEGHGVLSPELFVEAPEQEDWEDDETRDQMAIQGDERSPLNAPPSSLPERITRKLKPGDLMPDLEQQLQHALAVDADVVAFCDYQFTRMAEELTRTDGKKTLEKHVRGQFVPRVSGEVVGMVGSVYSVIELNVTFRETNGREQKLKIQLAPALSAVVGSPDRVRSSTTGAWVRRERAIATRTGDDWVEEENAVACAWTGDRLHPEQVRPCRLTGLMVDEALLSDAEILDPLLDLSVHTLPESCDEMLLTDLHERAQQIGLPVLRKARRAWRAKAPIAGTQAVIAEVPKLLGMGTRRLAFVMAEGHLVGQTGSL